MVLPQEKIIFGSLPAGFKEDSQMVCLLKKGLYGLKQASRAWKEKFNHFLIQYGFTRSNADSCVYFQRDENNITIIAILVDDGLLCSNHQSKLEDIVNYLSDKFKITSGPVDHFVGLEISRDRCKGPIHISQQAYVKKILARFKTGECKPRSVPADPGSHLEKELFTSETQYYPYSEAIGSLMFAAICTRPDISYAVGQVAKYSSKPSHVYWEAIKRIFAYLKGIIPLESLTSEELKTVFCKPFLIRILPEMRTTEDPQLEIFLFSMAALCHGEAKNRNVSPYRQPNQSILLQAWQQKRLSG